MSKRIRNTSAGPRGAYLKGNYVQAEPGETIEADDFPTAYFEEVGEGGDDDGDGKSAERDDGASLEGDALDERIAEVVAEELDVNNEAHWTNGGKPLVEVVSEKVGTDVSRADIDRATGGFTRPSE